MQRPWNRRAPFALNDLGWALVEAGSYEEARSVLEQAVALAKWVTICPQ